MVLALSLSLVCAHLHVGAMDVVAQKFAAARAEGRNIPKDEVPTVPSLVLPDPRDSAALAQCERAHLLAAASRTAVRCPIENPVQTGGLTRIGRIIRKLRMRFRQR